MFLLQNLLRVVLLLLIKQHKRKFQKRQRVRSLRRNLLQKQLVSLDYLRKRKHLLTRVLKQVRQSLLRDSKGLRRKKLLLIIKRLRVQSLQNLLLLRQVQIYQMTNSALYDAQVYLKNVQDSQAIASNYAGQPAYAYQNDVLNRQVQNKKRTV